MGWNEWDMIQFLEKEQKWGWKADLNVDKIEVRKEIIQKLKEKRGLGGVVW